MSEAWRNSYDSWKLSGPPEDDLDEEETTYICASSHRIVRYYADLATENETIVRGLTLEQAEAHCQRDDTHGDGWFDGYRAES